jgi:hypothetical protein
MQLVSYFDLCAAVHSGTAGSRHIAHLKNIHTLKGK